MDMEEEDIQIKIEKEDEEMTIKSKVDDTDEESEISIPGPDEVILPGPVHGSCFEIPQGDENEHEDESTSSTDNDDPLATFKCKKCESEFTTKDHLAQHRHIAHPFLPGRGYREKCPFCYYLDVPRYLESHVRLRHRDKKIQIYPCKLCSQKFIRDQHLKDHTNKEHVVHSNTDEEKTYHLAGREREEKIIVPPQEGVAEKKRVYKCSRCPEWPGASSSGLRHHRRRIHPTTENDKIINERNRERSFLYKRRKREEMMKKGQNSNTKITRKLRSEIQRRQAQDEDGSYKCDICEMTFESGRDLASHNRKHIRFNCTEQPDCGKSYTTKKLLESHVKGDHKGDKPFKCELCDNKCYATKVQLNRHLKSSHSDPREKKISCHHCDLKFVTNVLLKNHMRKHTGEKAFICEKCGKGFNETKHLTEHIIFKHRYDEDVQEKYWRQDQD